MSAQIPTSHYQAGAEGLWAWRPADAQRNDKSEILSGAERRALTALGRNPRDWQEAGHWPDLQRLIEPLREARHSLHTTGQRGPTSADNAAAFILQSCMTEQRAYWGWDGAAWTRVCGHTPRA